MNGSPDASHHQPATQERFDEPARARFYWAKRPDSKIAYPPARATARQCPPLASDSRPDLGYSQASASISAARST